MAWGLSTVGEYLFTLFSEVCCVLISPFLVMFLLGKAAGEAKKKKKNQKVVSVLKTIVLFSKVKYSFS